MKSNFICVDFDGTIVKHEYPNIGGPVPYAIQTIKDLQALGHKIILYTMRGHKPYIDGEIKRDTLQEAIDYLAENGITPYAINENPTQKYWTSSNKIYGNLYIDDVAFGAPLIQCDPERPYVDWLEVRKYFSL